MAGTTRKAERPTPPGLLSSTGFLLSKLGLEARRRYGDALAALGLRPPHHGVLAYLVAYGPSAQVDVVQALSYDASDMVTFIDLLEERGYVRRERDPADRRRYAVSITPAGQEVFATTSAAADGTAAELLAGLSDEDQQVLHDLLLRALAAFDPRAVGKSAAIRGERADP